MIFCTKCGAIIPEGKDACALCGKPAGEAHTPARLEPRSALPVPASEPSASDERRSAPMRTSQFFGSLLLLGIPLVGQILMLVWTFSRKVNVNRRNLARAALIYFLIAVVIGVAVWYFWFQILALLSSVSIPFIPR